MVKHKWNFVNYSEKSETQEFKNKKIYYLAILDFSSK